MENTDKRFSQVQWHDSKLLELRLLRHTDKKQYDLELDLDLVIGFSEGRTQRCKKKATFEECRIIQTELDLLGVLICDGAIASAVCYADAIELEKKIRGKAERFDFPEAYNPLERCLGFLIELLNPSGEIAIFARDFQIE